MKIQELRKLLSTADREALERAFAESYKQLRKGQKEEIDPVLVDILEGKTVPVQKKKSESTVNFAELEQDIVEFIDNAYAQNYFAPNRIIPKSQRPKWRFAVKNFIKELDKVPPESENYSKAVKLLTDLYGLICEACNYYLFSTDDAFRSIGWEQYKFFDLVVKKTFAEGYSRENIAKLLAYATTGGLSRISLHIQQELVLLESLKTSDIKYLAIEEAKKLIEDRKKKLVAKGKSDSQRYYLNEAINELCNMILLISIALAEPESGINYYFKNSRQLNSEITLFCALDIIEIMSEDDLWIKVYEYGVNKKIKPRESLKVKYEEKKKQLSKPQV